MNWKKKGYAGFQAYGKLLSLRNLVKYSSSSKRNVKQKASTTFKEELVSARVIFTLKK